MTLICARCKQPFDLPNDADKDRPYVCDVCWKTIQQQAAEHIRIKVR